MTDKPNVVFVFADQWRAQACGYNGNPTVKTPNIDRLAASSVNVQNAVAGCPVCSPYRGSLLTGQYPLTHGVYANDVLLDPDALSLAKVMERAGYETAYIGKWHLDGSARSCFTPPERRQGFKYWKALNCSHNYNESMYYTGYDMEPKLWEDYDAFTQTRDAQTYIETHADSEAPFFLTLSWGPPHSPYQTAPEEYRAMYNADDIVLPANVPEADSQKARNELAGYYAHVSALDTCVGQLLHTLEEQGIADNTIFILTSDHGDMLGSQGSWKKQQPWDESIRVPFLLRYPALLGHSPQDSNAVLDAPDIMPTLLSLCNLDIPSTVEGKDFSPYLCGDADGADTDALLLCAIPFGQWTRPKGGREYRGVRTPRYTYVRDKDGPWLLYDNERDPYQLYNQCNSDEYADIQAGLENRLQTKLQETGDTFAASDVYIKRLQHRGYDVDKTGTVTYIP